MKNLRKNYKAVVWGIVIALIGLFLLGYGLSKDKSMKSLTSVFNVESSAFPLSLATLEAIDDGKIDYEVKYGKIFVTVIDRYLDGHIHQLSHEGVSKKKALEILAKKKFELENR